MQLIVVPGSAFPFLLASNQHKQSLIQWLVGTNDYS